MTIQNISKRTISWEWVSRVFRGLWWVSVSWLALAAVAITWDLIRWFADSNNPVRYEYSIDAMVILFYYALPAVVGVLLVCTVPKTGLSVFRRLSGIGLLLFCIMVILVLDFFATIR